MRQVLPITTTMNPHPPIRWRHINALHLEWTEIGFFHWLSLHNASFLRNETLLSIMPQVPLCHILNKAAACLCDMWYISGISWLLLSGKWMATFLYTPLKKTGILYPWWLICHGWRISVLKVLWCENKIAIPFTGSSWITRTKGTKRRKGTHTHKQNTPQPD